MPRRTDSISLPILGCPCGYTTPPPWTDLNAAEHRVAHLTYLGDRRTAADRATTLRDVRLLCAAQRVLIAELHDLAARLRVTIHDRDDAIANLEFDLYDALRRLDELDTVR